MSCGHTSSIRSIYAESFDVEAYCQYLAGLWHIFSAIEQEVVKAGGPLAKLDDQTLHRREALQKAPQNWVNHNSLVGWSLGWGKQAQIAEQKHKEGDKHE